MAAEQAQHKSVRNRVIGSLPVADRNLVTGVLEPVTMPIRQRLEQANRRADYVYFPETGIASVIVKSPKGDAIEAGIIGSDGMTGLAAILGVDRPAHEIVIQLSGDGYRMPAAAFREALDRSAAFDLACRRYAHSFLIQTSFTALANGRNNIEQRLARWLLMAQDRAGTDDLALTHDFLAIMLGVRRAGVTLSISLLQRAGLVHHGRGRIRIIDRIGLIEITKGCYGPAEAHFDRLFVPAS